MSRPFRTSVPYYARYRSAYPPALIELLVQATGVGRDERVLDLGCGPGSLAIPLAGYASEVVAVDDEPEMITALRRAAPPNVTAVNAPAESVDESWGSFRLATAGRAVHWFDAPLVLDRLTALTPAVALVAERRHSEAEAAVLRIASGLIEKPRVERPKLRYADILAASAFSEVVTLTVKVERTWTPSELIGMAYSTSSAALERLGSRRREFEERVFDELKPSYREHVNVDAVIGRRPAKERS